MILDHVLSFKICLVTWCFRSLSSKRKSANPTPMKLSHTPLKTQTPSKVRRSHTDSNESSENIDFSVSKHY